MQRFINVLNWLSNALLLVVASTLLTITSASADILINQPGVDCTDKVAATSAVCKEHSTDSNPLTGCSANPQTTSGCGSGILIKITNIIAYIAGAAAIIMLVIGAIRYVTSGSDVSVGNRIDDDVLNARRTITNALIGLAIIVLAKTIITYVINKVG